MWVTMLRTNEHCRAGVFWFLFLLTTTLVKLTDGREAVLLDTRTALSDLGWTMSPQSEWQEMTSPDAQGNERRMNMVCQITKPNQDNWIRTDYIAAEGAQRLHVEMKFTIRSCEDVENVATCKETFNFYYYETDRDEATSTFPPWNEGSYTKVDTIAADQRFSPGSDDTNFETRDIGPITKNGLYLAFQDTGACVALMYIRVYYKYCEETISNLAVFGRTTAGSEMTSLEDTTGVCVQNAVATNGMQPILYCNAEGDWMVPSGTCTCDAGYQPNSEKTKCTACSPGYFKSTVSNDNCERCPAFSSSRTPASTSCRCTYGYFRPPADDANQACTMPASRPRNLYSVVNKTSVRLYWERPQNDGGRDEMWYSVQCFRCQQRFTPCSPCSNHINYNPSPHQLVQTEILISSLSSYAFYKFQIISINAVTNIAASSGHRINNYAEVTVQTNQAAPSAVNDVRVVEISTDSFVVVWNPPTATNGQITNYQVMVTSLADDPTSTRSNYVNHTRSLRLKVEPLQPSSRYVIKVRARTQEGFGPYSIPIRTKTNNRPTAATDDELTGSGTGVDISFLAIAIAGGVILVLAVVVVIFIWRRRTKANNLKMADKEKHPMFNGNSVGFNGSFPSPHKTYIDPTTYEDPNRAVREFTKEIDSACVKIEEVIGGGEFGEVCRGRLQPNDKSERDVAIKTLKSGYSTQQKLDFLGEASIMGQFDHPNVIRLEGVVTKSRPLMIITEFMENGSLDVFLRNHDNHFSVIQLVGMLRNIAAGMKYLSDMGYVHRDLAARNILVNAQLICKVSDFGMSRVLEEDSEAAYTARGGKIPIRWTAPEAFTYRKFTSASDVWSYGIVMWEVMSYGERPYWGMSNRDVMNAVETGYRLPAPMDCPQVQHRLMLDCWKKDRNQRPKFAQIVASLDKMLRDPAQLKIKAGHERPRNGRIPNSQCRPSSALGQAVSPTNSTNPVTRTASSPPHSSSTGDSGYSNEETDEEVPLVNSNDQPKSPAINVSSLGAWLESINLSHCKESFTRNGCTSLEQVLQLTHDDLERMGIDDTNDQDHLIEMIQKIAEENTDDDCHGRTSTVLPSYNESQRLTLTGISV